LLLTVLSLGLAHISLRLGLMCIYRVGQKKRGQIIFAITLSTASQFSQFLAHIHYRKFATRRCIVSPPNAVCVTALPCKILIMTLPVCLYMFTTINNNKHKHICTLAIVYVKKRHNADYGTLLKCYPCP